LFQSENKAGFFEFDHFHAALFTINMIKKSLFICLAIIPFAFLNGGLRELVLNPLLGEKFSLPLSGFSLCLLIFALCWFCIPRIGRGTAKTYWTIGLWWMLLTVLFETGVILLEGDTLSEVVKAYDITTGNLWLMCVLFIGIVPWLTAKTRNLI
jgi:hypothetical protein